MRFTVSDWLVHDRGYQTEADVMGQKYNDYLRLTKSYLREIDYYKTSARLLREKISDIEADLRGISTKIASYESTHGGYSDLNGIEAGTERRMQQESNLAKSKAELKIMEKHIAHIDVCINTLPAEEQNALRLYYIDKLTYGELSQKIGWSERTCKRKVMDATKSIAWMLFGDNVNQDVLFIEGGN
jgi:RNA polymerase sigma factor (sigma-70 family)